MRAIFGAGAMLVLMLGGCGGENNQASSPPSTSSSPTPSPTPTPTPVPAVVNDSYVRVAGVPSLDSATYGTRTFQGLPSLARVGNRIWTVWFGDTVVPGGEATGNFLILRYSDDGGVKWSREFYLVPANRQTDRILDSRLWLAPDGKLWVIYPQAGNSVSHDGQFGTWVAVIPNPLDEMPEFEPGVFLADGVTTRPFRYNDGWLVPIDYPFAGPRFPERAGMHVYKIDVANRRVAKLTTVPRVIGADYNEPNLVQLRNGGLFSQSRSNGWISENRTDGTSLTWPAAIRFSAFTSATSRTALARSPTGRLVMVFNQRADGHNRADMTIAFSDDDGLTWPYSAIFDNRTGVSYPDIDFDANGDVLVVYDYFRWRGKVLLARIDEQSIVDGKGSPKFTINLVHEIPR